MRLFLKGPAGSAGSTGSTGPQGPSGTVELAYAEMTTAQSTTNTSASPVDLTGLTVSFTVGTRPVYVIFNAVVYTTIVAAAAFSNKTWVQITDASNVEKRSQSITGPITNGTSAMWFFERIPAGTGSVTRKARFYVQGTSNTANVFGSASSPATLTAWEM
jgi:hypothetical protein